MDAALRTLRILWGAILSSSVLFLVLALALKPEQDPPAIAFAGIMGLVALTMAFASTVVPGAMYRSALRRTKIPTREVDDPTQLRGLAKQRVAVDPTGAAERVLRQYSAPFVLGLALGESVGLFGFVLGFLGFSTSVVVPFFLVCWAVLVSKFPTTRKILEPAERTTGVRLRPGHG